jgi:hypothetical protein
MVCGYQILFLFCLYSRQKIFKKSNSLRCQLPNVAKQLFLSSFIKMPQILNNVEKIMEKMISKLVSKRLVPYFTALFASFWVIQLIVVVFVFLDEEQYPGLSPMVAKVGYVFDALWLFVCMQTARSSIFSIHERKRWLSWESGIAGAFVILLFLLINSWMYLLLVPISFVVFFMLDARPYWRDRLIAPCRIFSMLWAMVTGKISISVTLMFLALLIVSVGIMIGGALLSLVLLLGMMVGWTFVNLLFVGYLLLVVPFIILLCSMLYSIISVRFYEKIYGSGAMPRE